MDGYRESCLRGGTDPPQSLDPRVHSPGRASGQALDLVADWPCCSRAAYFDSGAPESENDCASSGEVVVYQPERTAVNLFVDYQCLNRNGKGKSDAGIPAKLFRKRICGPPAGRDLPDRVFKGKS